MNKRITKSIGLSVTLLLGANAGFAQLTGTKTIPGNYASVSAAIAALNAQGVGSGGVTFNVAAGYTETLSAGPLSITASGTAANPIVFQKSGNGANPVIMAYTGGTATTTSATPDGIWNLAGADYITINGIDVAENGANSGAALMEYGYGLFKASATNGAQHNTIQNCNITLNRLNVTTGTAPMMDGSVGIVMVNSTPTAATTALVPTTTDGANSFNHFYGNTIQNTNIGIGLNGYTDASSYTNADYSNDIGGSSAITGNVIFNYGGGTVGTTNYADTLVSGVLAMNQYDFNASYNSINNNNGLGVTHNTIIHGIFNRSGAGANASITNNTLTISRNINVPTGYANTQRIAVIENGAGGGGSNNTINISNNHITNCRDTATVIPTSNNAWFYGVWNNPSATAANVNINNNTFDNDTTYLTNGSMYMIVNAGVISNALSISNNNFNNLILKGPAASNSFNLTGLYTNSSVAGPACITNYDYNTFSNFITLNPTSGNILCMNVNAGGVTAAASMSNNSITNITVSKAAGTVTGLSFTNNNAATSANNVTIQNNNINGFTATGTGAIALSGLLVNKNAVTTDNSTFTLNNNSVRNLNNLGGSGATMAIGCLGATTSSTQIFQITNNTVDSVTATATATTSIITGLSIIGGTTGSNVGMNTVRKMYSAGGASGHYMYGIQFTGASGGFNVYGNKIDSIFCASASVNGIAQSSSSALFSYYNNKINNLSGNGSGSSVYGMNIGGASGTLGTPNVCNIYNNVIGNLKAPAATAASNDVIRGIYLPNESVYSSYKISYNTILIDASSSGAVFSTTGISHNSNPAANQANLILRNNVIVNRSTTGTTTTGIAAAIRRLSQNETANFDLSSDNNLLYASSIYYDGTNNLTTLAAYHNAFPSQGLHSVTGDVAFQSTSGLGTDYLKPDAAIATPIESGGTAIAGITTDINGNTRNSVTPDLGAYESTYAGDDIISPIITFTALGDTTSTASRVVTAFATIYDASGINNNNGVKPRLYYKKATDANYMLGNTSSDNGWKYVQSTSTSSPYDFTIDYSILNGGGVVSGDQIQYFVVAQDNATPNNAGPNNMMLLAGVPASVALTQPPISGWNSYKILNQYSGTYNVGTGQAYASLTNAGGLFEAINAGVVVGDINAVITSDLTGETGAVSLTKFHEEGVGNYNMKIVPNSTTERLISGTSSAGLITFSGARNVTVDGSLGTSNKYLRIRNTATTTAASAFLFVNDAKYDTLTNCYIEGAGGASSGVLYLSSSTAAGATGNDHIAIMNNTIRDFSQTTGVPSYFIRTNSSPNASNDSAFIYNNEFVNWSNIAINIQGSNGASGWTVQNNAFYQTASRTTVIYGMQITVGGNHFIDNNNFGGSNADRSGTPIQTANTIYGIYTTAANTVAAPITISNNRISNMGTTSTSASTVGIYSSSYANITGNTIGGYNVYDTLYTPSIGVVGISIQGNNNTVTNNLIRNLKGKATGGSSYSAGIYSVNATINISNNIIDNVSNYNSKVFDAAVLATSGILVNSVAAGSSNIIANNTISNIANMNTSTTISPAVAGIFMNGPGGSFIKVYNNKVSNIYGTNAATSYSVAGICDYGAGIDTLYNNMLQIGNLTNSLSTIRGFSDMPSSGPIHVYFNNSVNLTGNLSNANASAAFFRGATGSVVLRNNIFSNQRTTTGAGFNYAIQNMNASGWTATTADYNMLYASDANNLGYWVNSASNFDGWKNTSGSDMNAVTGNVPFMSSTDLHIDQNQVDAWNVFGRGIAMPSYGLDVDSNNRSMVIGTPVTIGADEIGMPTEAPANMIMTPATPTVGTPTVFYSAGRKIAEINWTGTAPTTLSAKYYPGVQAPLSPAPAAPMLNSYFNVTVLPDVSTYNYTIKSYYTDAEGNAIADNVMTGIKSHNSNPYTVTDLGATSALDANGKYITSTPLNNFSIFSMMGIVAPLPVTLVDISARNQGSQNNIDWTTATERTTDKFELERSIDGKFFNTIASLNANGKASNYTYYDTKAVTGVNYYRLKLVDATGTFTYSKVVNAEVKAATTFSVQAYPNPVQNKVSLKINGIMQSNAAIQMTDVTGKLLQNIKVNSNEMDVNMNELPSGIYFIRYTDDQQSQIIKISKQ